MGNCQVARLTGALVSRAPLQFFRGGGCFAQREGAPQSLRLLSDSGPNGLLSLIQGLATKVRAEGVIHIHE
jgi:hypothetical protein